MTADRGRRSPRRAAALLLAGAVAAGAWVGVVSPILDEVDATRLALRSEREQIDVLRVRIAALSFAGQGGGTAREALPVWDGEADGVLTAEIQSGIQRLATEAAVELSAIGSQPTPAIAGRQAVGFVVESRAPYDRASRFLHAIESHAPLLLVDRATIRVLNAPAGAAIYPLVHLRLDISAPLGREPEEKSR